LGAGWKVEVFKKGERVRRTRGAKVFEKEMSGDTETEGVLQATDNGEALLLSAEGVKRGREVPKGAVCVLCINAFFWCAVFEYWVTLSFGVRFSLFVPFWEVSACISVSRSNRASLFLRRRLEKQRVRRERQANGERFLGSVTRDAFRAGRLANSKRESAVTRNVPVL